jgi:hypothetical protein
MLGRILPVVRGGGEVQIIKHIINLDAATMIPQGLELHEEDQPTNRARGMFEWSPDRVRMYLSEHQKNGKVIKGYKLREELAKEPVLPDNVLDYLMEHPHLIPEDWKTMADGKTIRYTFFWGKIYRDRHGDLCVRYLYFGGGQWQALCHWLGNVWDVNCPAALAS